NCPPCAADVVQDGAVNGVDLAAVINAWGTDGGKLPRADIDGNGIVDGVDLANILGSWGSCP
ncbi:MAG: Dockerin type domain, partial [Planctomycetota bacterium]